MTTRLSAVVLNVSDPERLAEFYCRVLGMERSERDGHIAAGYGRAGAALVFKPAEASGPYAHRSTDRYWKIALTVPDVDCAHAQLLENGVNASTPHQFRDVGYLSHFTDPEGHIIELVQHTFAGEAKTRLGDPDAPLGGGAEIGLVTLRSTDIAKDIDRCEAATGLKYLVREQVFDLGFDLYFLGNPDDAPPSSDPDALINRPWIYQRPYTVLEFQHLKNHGRVDAPVSGQNGYQGLIFGTAGNGTPGYE